MRAETAAYLKAPVASGKLELEVFDLVGDDVVAGRLVDGSTGEWYRIDEGIADLSPPEYRNYERYELFCRKHRLEHGPAPQGVGRKDDNTLKQIQFFSNAEAYEAEVVTSPFYEILDGVTVGRWVARNVTEGLRVVEVGCGSGRQTIPLIEAGADVVAVDLSEGLLKLARSKVTSSSFRGRADFVIGTAETLPLIPGAFDAGLIFGSLHHFSDPPAALLCIAKTIKAGGQLYMMEPHDSPVRFIFDWMMRKWTLWKEEANDDPLFNKSKFQTWLNAGGFDSQIYYSTYLPPHLFYRIKGRSGERLLAATDMLFNAIPGIRRLGGVIIAEAVKRRV